MEAVAHFVVELISTLGYPGIIIAMAIESALIPLPSEIIMPFSGYLVSTGRFDFWLVTLCGAIGNVLGSALAYGLGYWGQEPVVRRLVKKYGRFVLVTEHDLDQAMHLLDRYKDLVAAGSRMLPGIRTVISLPCGMAHLPFIRFCILTFFGSFIWSALLAYVGVYLGERWDVLGPLFHGADAVIAAILVGLAVLYVVYKLREGKHTTTG